MRAEDQPWHSGALGFGFVTISQTTSDMGLQLQMDKQILEELHKSQKTIFRPALSTTQISFDPQARTPKPNHSKTLKDQRYCKWRKVKEKDRGTQLQLNLLRSTEYIQFEYLTVPSRWGHIFISDEILPIHYSRVYPFSELPSIQYFFNLPPPTTPSPARVNRRPLGLPFQRSNRAHTLCLPLLLLNFAQFDSRPGTRRCFGLCNRPRKAPCSFLFANSKLSSLNQTKVLSRCKVVSQ